jgi:hypothetical protein
MRLQVTIKGDRPLLMQSDRLVNPFDPTVKEIKRITSKKTNKTEDDLLRLSNLEWAGSLYYDKDLGPFIPGENLLACLKAGAKRTRKGKDVLRAVTVVSDFMPLLYDGPRDMAGMWEHSITTADGEETHPFRYVKSVVVQRARTMRTRPKFDSWALQAELILNPTIMDRETFEEVLVTAGEQEGIGTYRPRFGRFGVVEVKALKN